ncbi:survival motor neuron protein [Thrips palmi]|uniref:Survival motor neuron protein n=1 Tax=Thrips palmi TaxID=161013 RepID=A0A6P8YKN4_THRPL|nr:survival motor neuron protein [Thrips palmi]
MSKVGETPQVLFARGSQDGDSTADDWDDTELLKEYDRAVRPLKALVAERMGLSNAEIEEASATESGSSRSVLEKDGSKVQKRHQKKRRRKGKSKQHREWAAGDHCQAKFTVDEQLYEATVVSIDHDRGTCIVQYVGYGNSEEQPLSALSHSMGAAVRREQVNIATLKAEDTEAAQSDDPMERSSEASSTISLSKMGLGDSSHKNANAQKSRNPPYVPRPPHFSAPSNSGGPRLGVPNFSGIRAPSAMNDMVPPPLPPHVLASLPGDDSEALSAMLMSWYMSGFHTGYYQGLKRAKNFSQS